MEVHAGTVETPTAARKESKSEILFCAAPRSTYADASTYDGQDLSDVLLPNGMFMGIVSIFKYLGSYVARNGSDSHDVESRIASAGKAFGALSACLFKSTHVTREAKRRVYEGLVLAILLYGSECWVLTETLRMKLRAFHAQCLRTMSGTKLSRMRAERISTWELQQHMGLDSMDNYVDRRRLRWLGHVHRMPFHRTPRRMLTAWVARRPYFFPGGGH